MLKWISQYIEDRFYIDDKGNLYTDFGKRKMSDNSLQEAKNIIQDLLNKVPYSEITSKYNISKSTVSSIKNKRNWAYLTKGIKFK